MVESFSSCGFHNETSEVVNQAIEGLQMNLTSITAIKGQNVLIRKDWVKDRVALICGGGSGHEPSHGGFLGRGALTAAVCGNVFASPSISQIMCCIREVCGAAGCLLIVKNYTGDRVNFGVALEQARGEGFQVEMVVCGDDAALKPVGTATGRRGLAGTLFIHKVAGAAAEEGKSLAEVTAVAQSVADNVSTLGVSLSTCTLPGQSKSGRIPEGKMEVGLGIHGEPGLITAPIMKADDVADLVLLTIMEGGASTIKFSGAHTHPVLMVNNLGGTTPLEIFILLRRAVAYMKSKGHAVERVVVGSLMTSLEMAGFSFSLFAATAE